MSDLMLMLKPNEEAMINGVVIRNRGQGTHFYATTPDTRILRMSEAIQPVEATTQLKKAHYIAQLGVGGALDAKEALRILKGALSSLEETYGSAHLEQASTALRQGRLNRVLRQLAILLQSESDQHNRPRTQSATQEAEKLYVETLSDERPTMRRTA